MLKRALVQRWTVVTCHGKVFRHCYHCNKVNLSYDRWLFHLHVGGPASHTINGKIEHTDEGTLAHSTSVAYCNTVRTHNNHKIQETWKDMSLPHVQRRCLIIPSRYKVYATGVLTFLCRCSTALIIVRENITSSNTIGGIPKKRFISRVNRG
jgi:hypothetical protein